jgi:hypothetical protein
MRVQMTNSQKWGKSEKNTIGAITLGDLIEFNECSFRHNTSRFLFPNHSLWQSYFCCNENNLVEVYDSQECQRIYHVKYTSSHTNTEVKQHWAWIILGWEFQVLMPPLPPPPCRQSTVYLNKKSLF